MRWIKRREELTHAAAKTHPSLEVVIGRVTVSGTIGGMFGSNPRTFSRQQRRLHLRNHGSVAINARASITITIAQTTCDITIHHAGPIVDEANPTVTLTITESGVSRSGSDQFEHIAGFIESVRTKSRLASDLVFPFNVAYWDSDRRFGYGMPHILTVPMKGNVRVEWDTTKPEPEPIPLGQTPYVS